MKIDDKYLIETDENNFILKEVRISGEKSKVVGEERFVTLGYYGNLKSALDGYVRNSSRDNLPDSCIDVVLKLEEINKNILNLRLNDELDILWN